MNNFLPETMYRKCAFVIATVCLLCLPLATAHSADKSADAEKAESKSAEETLAGHSYHGEVFNEGPRRQAYLMEGTGDVHFDVTVKNPAAQKFLDQALGQLHGFWYLEAERSFRHAANLDPDCAMAFCHVQSEK